MTRRAIAEVQLKMRLQLRVVPVVVADIRPTSATLVALTFSSLAVSLTPHPHRSTHGFLHLEMATSLASQIACRVIALSIQPCHHPITDHRSLEFAEHPRHAEQRRGSRASWSRLVAIPRHVARLRCTRATRGSLT